MTRGRPAVAAGVLTAGLVASIVVVTGGPTSDAGSTAALDFDVVPESYVVRYETSSGADLLVQVMRPWASRTVVGEQLQRADLGILAIGAEDAETAAFVSLPAIAPGDLRPDIALPDAVARGLAEIGERKVVNGTECQTYLTRAPLDAEPIAPPGETVVASCIDDRGLLLEERQSVSGREVLSRMAVEVLVPGPVLEGPNGVEQLLLDVDEGGAAMRPIPDVEALRIAAWHLDAVPGFELVGAFATVHANPKVQTDPLERFTRVASVTWVWEDGHDVVILETGAVTDGSSVPIPGGGVSIGRWPGPLALDDATLLVSARGNELRHSDGDGFLRLLVTLPTDRLLEIASMVRATGTSS